MKSKSSTTKGGGNLPPSFDPDLAQWCSALASPVVTDIVPPGWLTTKQLCKKLGKAGPTMGALLCRAVAEGRCEKKLFRIQSGQVNRPVPHYRLK
jgi:hypothetical protein